MKRRRLVISTPYLSPSATPRELSPQVSPVPAKPGGFFSDRNTAVQTRSPPSSSSSSSASSPVLSSSITKSSFAAMAASAPSRPMSVAHLSSAYRPTLQDILSNSAPPPWTLGAFMAYLSQNHCLETLEFTMEAERYQAAFAQVQAAEGAADASRWSPDSWEHIASLWQKLINAYILPYGPREVNLPGPVRDRLLGLNPAVRLPWPSELNEAVQIVFDLMNDSVLLPFLDSMSAAAQQEQHHHHLKAGDIEDHQEARQGRPRLRMPKDAAAAISSSANSKDSSRSPKASFLQLNLGRRTETDRRSPSISDDAADRGGLVDDSGSSSATPPPGEPLTPPTTPPTSDWGTTSPPGGLQRAITVHSVGWKRMSAKLGLSRKGRSGRRSNHPSSNASSSRDSNSDGDASTAGTGREQTDGL